MEQPHDHTKNASKSSLDAVTHAPLQCAFIGNKLECKFAGGNNKGCIDNKNVQCKWFSTIYFEIKYI